MSSKYFRGALVALTVGAATALVVGCGSTPEVTDSAQEKPILDLKAYFNGTVTAQGIFTDRSGKVVKRFTVLMKCTWTGNQGVLDEEFTYSDGTKQRRVWRLTQSAENQYTGTADDVVGIAKGRTSGNAFRWNYTLRLPVDGKEYEVQFDDWMYLMDDKVMLNKAVMTKFGLRLGEITLAFNKSSP